MTRAGGQRRLDALSLATFVALGLPDGMLGTAWPALRHSFGAPVGDLGLVLLVSTTGSVLVTVFVGYLIRRLGVPVLLATGLTCAAAAGAGFAVAPAFGVVLGVALLFGVAAGLMDGGLNTAVGLSGRRRLLNLLHGAYGVGTAVGPLVVTVALLGGSWRPAYLVLLAVDVALGVLWLLHRRGRRRRADPAPGPGPGPSSGDAGPAPAAGPGDAGPAPVAGPGAAGPGSEERPQPAGGGRRYGGAIVAGIAMFFVYTGLEVSAGQWETTFARTHLQLSASAAGLATFGYWAALTAARIGLALVPRPPSHQAVVRWGCLVAVGAAGLIWWDPATPATVVGFVILGASLAGVFPALIALTPGRLGERRASNVIAWQVGAAAAGGAGISALVGLLIGVTSVAVLGPALVVLAILLVGVELALTRLAPLES
ncbi:MAG TPA: MFS transporter [Acidimicrobiales bacterium]|nr:MFS transporter [Acidimicrobiales bacterium]